MKFSSMIAVLIAFCSLFFDTLPLQAAVGDTTRVQMYAGRRFYTTGDMEYDQSVKFPAAGKTYSQIKFNLKLACPCGPLMGEWDYTVTFYTRRLSGLTDSTGKPLFEFVELARFITPYWKYKPTTLEYTWDWDVTDYAALLQGDSVWLKTSYSGYSQSALFTAWFDFVEGTPPYTVTDIKTLWQGSWGYGNPASPINNHLSNKKFKMPSTANSTRLRIITTGHGGGGTDNAAEFSNKTHTIWVGGQQRYSQHLWREDCMVNPVYPQDGTWPISRGGWCPGDIITPWEQDITSFITSGDSTRIDYKMQDYTNLDLSKGASYSTTGQVIYTSAPNFQNNVALMDIKQPNSESPYNRSNPICGAPSLRIKNLAGSDLSTLEIQYGIKGMTPATYTWKGTLGFLEETEIVLPKVDWTQAFEGAAIDRVFEVTLLNPNGKPDQDMVNNSGKSTFSVPPLMYNEFEMRLLTNKQAGLQYSYSLYNADGDQLTSRSGMSDDTQYVDSLFLPDGCYEFRLKNSQGYGLSWWATQSSLGNGSLLFSSLGKTITTFPGDFGGEIFHQFRVGPKPIGLYSTSQLNFGAVNIGAKKEMIVNITPKNDLGLEITNVYVSLKIRGFSLKKTEPAISGKLQLKFGDTLKVTVEFAPTTVGSKTTTLAIANNEQRNSLALVNLIGSGGPTSVEEFAEQHLLLEVKPNISSNESIIQFSDEAASGKQARLVLINSLGQEVAQLFNGIIPDGGHSITLNSHEYPIGVYYLVLRSVQSTITSPVSIVR
ncbi:MAG: hypothetical protein IPM69_05420 [Ignavibacteria bacterium]|nr:hypothetical protein [Ignavibacteria bacterium]